MGCARKGEVMKIYLAHPISGLSGEEVVKYFANARDTVREMGYEPLQPMTGKGELRTEREFKSVGYGTPVSTNHAIFERDNWMIRQADVVYVDLFGCSAISIGCTMELAAAAALGKHTVVVMEDTNPHRHAFVIEASDIIFETPNAALEYLESLAHAWL